MIEGGFRSIRALAEGCGLAPATLAKRIQKERESGSARIDGHTIQRIARTTGFDAHWIMTGEGSPYPGDVPSRVLSSPSMDRTPPPVGGSSKAEPGREDSIAGRPDSIGWGREVVEALVRQGIAATRARQAVGALLLETQASYASVLELYQASLDRLGYAHAPIKKETESSSVARSQSRARPRGGATHETDANDKRDANHKGDARHSARGRQGRR